MVRFFRSFSTKEVDKEDGKKEKAVGWHERLQYSPDNGVTWIDVPRVVDEAGLANVEKEVEDSKKPKEEEPL